MTAQGPDVRRQTAENDAGACVRATTLREVITEALADAERTGMTGQTRDEWVAIAILGSALIPLHSHFPAEGGGPCPTCGGSVFSPARALPAADTGPATCAHGQPEGDCASCAACAACDGSCGSCPYAVADTGPDAGDAEAVERAAVVQLIEDALAAASTWQSISGQGMWVLSLHDARHIVTELLAARALPAADTGSGLRARIEALADEWERQARLVNRKVGGDTRIAQFAHSRALRAALADTSEADQ